MSPRRLFAVGVSLLCIAFAWGVVRAVKSRPEAADVVRAEPDGDSGSTAAGEKLTLRFYRDPLVVPSFTVHDLDGRTISSSSFRGRVTIVNFWATWCPPCRAEIPDLIALQNKYRDKLQIIGISEDDASADVVRAFVKEHQMNYEIAMSSDDIRKIFPGVSALPTSFIIDRDGRVVQKHVGMLSAALTELETRSLAGLAVNARIEQVDRATPAKLENAAATTIPGIDLSKLSASQRVAALQKLNSDGCTCGCDLTLAKCRIDDPTCGVSLPLARQVVQQIAAAQP